jgi:hypothetical protein
MPRQPILYEMRMNVIRSSEGGFVVVPGCEPTSTLTSTSLQANLEEAGCNCAIVSVEDILEAIPGSTIQFLPNNGREGAQKVLILPAVDLECPCGERPDFYQTLKDLCREATEEEQEIITGCDSFSLDSCQNRPEWRGQVDT